MSCILGGHPLSGEYVSQVSVAITTAYFYSPPIRIGETLDSLGEMLVKRGPAAAGIKLSLRRKEWCFTSAANIRTVSVEIIILAAKGSFCPMAYDDIRFFGC